MILSLFFLQIKIQKEEENSSNTPLHFDGKKPWVVIIHLQETEENVGEKKTKIVVDTARGQ